MTGTAGGLSFYLGASTDTGRWWVERERLCYKWARWFKSETRCMKVRQDGGTRIQWEKDDGETGTATVTVAVRPKPAPPVNIASAAPPTAAGTTAAAAPSVAARATTPPPVRNAATPPPALKAGAAPVAKAAPLAAKASTATPPKPTAPAARPNAVAATAAPAKSTPKAPAAAAIPNMRVAAAPTPPYRIGGPPPPAYRVVSVATDDVLNVRGGPSTEHMAVAAIGPDATDVQILGPCRAEWCFVRHGDIVGWVNTYYLEEIAISAR
jgi:hypothetical protein